MMLSIIFLPVENAKNRLIINLFVIAGYIAKWKTQEKFD
jgi:hypothetical protein